MRLEDCFPSKYLRAADISEPFADTVESVEMEEFETGSKPVMVLADGRQIVLNKTRFSVLAAGFGSETDEWLGRRVEVSVEQITFRGQLVAAIRVRVPAAVPVTAGAGTVSDSGIPF